MSAFSFNAFSMNNQITLAIVFTAGGLVFAIALLVAQGRYRAQSRRDFEELRRSLELEHKLCADTFFELKENLAQVREESQRETPRPGALSRGARAEAMRLLRSGLAPETAASSLGIGRREMRLLERVAQTLCVR
jgi:hypothetical protein